MKGKRRNAEQSVGDVNEPKKKKVKVEKLNAFETKFGANELVAVYAGEANGEGIRSFFVGNLQDDVLMGDSQGDQVDVLWLENVDENPNMYHFTDSSDPIQVGSIICSIERHVAYSADGSSVHLSASCGSFVEAQLAKQLADDYDQDEDEELGDEAYHVRLHTSKYAKSGGVRRSKGLIKNEDDVENSGSVKKMRKKKNSKKTLLPLMHVATDRADVHASVSTVNSFSGDTLRASQQLVAAVRGGNREIVLELLADEERIHSVSVPQSVDVSMTGMWLAATRGEKELVMAFIRTKKSDKDERRVRAPLPKSEIVQLSSGKHTSRFSDYNRREIYASRGGKQGNNAFVREETTNLSSNDVVDVRKSPEFDPLLDCDLVTVDILEAMFCDRWRVETLWNVLSLETLALCGNRAAVASLLRASQHSNGFNFVHLEVLGDAPDELNEESGPFSKPVRASSVVKRGATSNRVTPIHLACINPCTVYLEHLLRVNPSAQGTQDLSNRTLLHYAASCAENNAAPLRYLLSNCPGLDRNAVDKSKTTPLIIAARCGNAPGIRSLLSDAVSDGERELMLHHCEARGWSPLLRAIRSERTAKLEAVRALLEAGADADMPASSAREKVRPVHVAAMIGDVAALELLRDFGADIAAVDKLGRTAVVHAATNGHVATLTKLLRWGVSPTEPDTSENAPLHYAAAYGWTACVRLLVEDPKEGGAGVDPNVLNSWKTAPISLAIQKGKHDVARFFLQTQRADINIVDAAGDPLLFTCVRRYLEEVRGATIPSKCDKLSSLPWTLRALLNKPALDLSKRDLRGNTVLHVLATVDMRKACLFYQQEALALTEMLIAKGAPVDGANQQNEQPIISAAKCGNSALVRIFLPATDLTTCIDRDGNTLAHLALAHPEGRVLQAVFEQDKVAFENMTSVVNRKGETPLVLAAHQMADNGDKEDALWAMLFLLEHGPTAAEEATWIEKPVTDVLHPDKLSIMLLEKNKKDRKTKSQNFDLYDIESFVPCNPRGSRNALHVLAAGLSEDPLKALHVLQTLAPFLENHADLRKRLVGAHADDSGLTPLLHVLEFAQTQRLSQSCKNNEGCQMDLDDVDDDDFRVFDLDEFGMSRSSGSDLDSENGCVIKSMSQHVSEDWFDVIMFWVNVLGADINQRKKHLFSSQTEMNTFKHSDEADASHVKLIEAEAMSLSPTGALVNAFAILMELRRKLAFKRATKTLEKLPTPHALVRHQQGALLRRLHIKLDIELTSVDHAGNTVIHVGIENGLPADLVAWLCKKQQALCLVHNAVGATPLHLAAMRDDATVLKAVLGALPASAVNAKDSAGKTALHISVCQAVQRTTEALEPCEMLLLQSGANVNAQDVNGHTPLHYAFIATSTKNEKRLFNFPYDMDRSKQLDPIQVVRTLCSANQGFVNVSITDKCGRTPLHYACSIGATVSSLVLLRSGASLCSLDKDRNSPLAVAILCKLATFTILLLKANPEPNDLVKGHMVHEVRRVKVKRRKCEKGYAFKIKSSETHTCMWYAIRYELEGVVFLMLDEFPPELAIADALECRSFQLVLKLILTCSKSVVLAVHPDTNVSLLHRVCQVDDFCGEPKWGVVLWTKLMELGADPLAVDNQRRSALHMAASRGHLTLCRYLIETYSLDKDALDAQGRTPLASFLCASKSALGSEDAAELVAVLFSTASATFEAESSMIPLALSSSVEVVGGPNVSTVTEKLQDKNKDNVKSISRSKRKVRSGLVTMAVLNASFDVLDVLLRNNADPEQVDSDGFRALHYAVSSLQATDAAELLLRYGADCNGISDTGLTPLMLAVNSDNTCMVELLLRYGADPTVCEENGETVLHHAARTNRAAELVDMLVNATCWVRLKSTPIDENISDCRADVLMRFHSEPMWRRGRMIDRDTFQLTIFKSADEHKAEVKALLSSSGYDEHNISRILNSGKVKNLADVADYHNFKGACFEVGAWGDYQSRRTIRNYKLPADYEQSNKRNLPFMKVSDTNATIVAIPDHLLLCSEELDAELIECTRSVSIMAGYTDDQLRKELVRFSGAEHLLLGNEHEALTKPFDVDDGVLVVEDQGTLREAVVLCTNPNGTVDLRLVRGTTRLGVRRSRLRPAFASLAWTPMSTTAAKIATAKFVAICNGKKHTALQIMAAPLALGGAFANCIEAAAVLRPHCQAADIRRAVELAVAQNNEPLVRFLWSTSTAKRGKLRGSMHSAPVVERSKAELAADLRAALKDRESRRMSACVNIAPPVNPVYSGVATAKTHVLPVTDGKDGDYYDVVLSKVDVYGGRYGVNVYYRMQIVCEPVRDLYVLITNWGRVDEYQGGKHQQSPYPKEEAITEFTKIYRSKTGNKWEDRLCEFEPVAKKYRRVRVLHQRFENPELPCLLSQRTSKKPSALPNVLLESLSTWTSPAALAAAGKHWGLDDSALPLGKLSMETLLEAEQQLEVTRLLLQRKKRVMCATPLDVSAMRDVMGAIAKTTNSFLMLLPMKEQEQVKPFDDVSFREAVSLIYGLKEMTTSIELVLAASHQKEMHPLDYCYRALGARIEPLPEHDLMRRCVEQYMRNTCCDNKDAVIGNVYVVTRNKDLAPGANAKMDSMGNKRLLWHGTPTANVLGILKNGLQVAPEEAPQCGATFGSGIYLADMFSKSYSYCHGWTNIGKHESPKAYLFLVEAALGKPLRVTLSGSLSTKARTGFDSVIGLGQKGPEASRDLLLDSTATAIPLGETVGTEIEKTVASIWSGSSRGIAQDDSIRIETARLNPQTTFPATVKLSDGRVVTLEQGVDSKTARITISASGNSAKTEEIQRTMDNSSGLCMHHEYIVPSADQVRIKYIVEVTSKNWLEHKFCNQDVSDVEDQNCGNGKFLKKGSIFRKVVKY